MVEPILHIIIPILVLLAFKSHIDKKLVFSLAILTVMPDLDYLVGHRSIFHNVFFVLFMSILVYLMFKFIINKDKNKKTAENKNAFYLSTYYLFFHILLDIGRPGIPFFYPFANKLFTFNFNLNAVQNLGKSSITAFSSKSYITSQPIIEAIKTQSVPVITNLGFILIFIVVILLLSTLIKKKLAKPSQKSL